MKKIIVFLVAFLLPSIGLAQVSSDIRFSGFGFWVQEFLRDGAATLKLKHVWLITDKQLGDSLEFRAFLAFQGPPKIIHTLFVKWRNPVAGVDYLRAGKFEPPFGHVNYYRIDRNLTVNYSSIDAPIVARAHGIEVAAHWQVLKLKLAAMSGERLLGNIPVANENRWDVYVRPQYRVLDSLTLGASVRFGPVGAWGADAQFELGSGHVEVECVSSRDTIGYSALGSYQIFPWLRSVLRYERVHHENILTPGLTFSLPYDLEIKLNAMYSRRQIQTILGQFIVRW